MSFETAFRFTLGHEGGYVDDPRDPGLETKYGISKRSYPAVDIKALTLEQAKERIAGLPQSHPAAADDVAMMLDFLAGTSPQRGIVR